MSGCRRIIAQARNRNLRCERVIVSCVQHVGVSEVSPHKSIFFTFRATTNFPLALNLENGVHKPLFSDTRNSFPMDLSCFCFVIQEERFILNTFSSRIFVVKRPCIT
ncbi:hypothetical protein NPIL_621971 [Nephila pilipes]|uniref:Uncharacterized protein n=1 Tax=Nephila pilipes TaxID=299642 RepID=A0A8X6QZX6_NEPPI|nr:hypothetical protein NPIL_621971 [Nephila pilipes]